MDQLVKQQITNTKKRFSIITAAYNIENYIERAIESVECQTFKDYELIIVNDCSTDNTGNVVKETMKKYDNIVYIEHTENKRAGGARNSALAVAKGEYIVFLDGDDSIASDNVLERLDMLIGQDKTDVIYLGFQIGGDREELVIPTEETCTKTYKAAMDKYPNPWSKAWRKEYLDENNIRFPEHRFYEDVLFVYKGVMKAKDYKMAQFVTHKYTSGRKNSMTTKINLKNVEDTILNLKELVSMRETEYTEEIDLIIKKEVKMCKKRLDNTFSFLNHK